MDIAVGIDIRPSDDSGVRRTPLSMIQLLLLNAIVCGLEFCASAGFTYIPPMLLKAGVEEKHMSMALGMGPLLALFIVPVIGRASDACQSRYGRRRPFILGLSAMVIVSLILIPYGEYFSYVALGNTGFKRTLGLILLTVGVVLLDFASQACLTPCEALLSDASKPTNQEGRCFMIYSFMCSLGGCIGYFITALDWNSSSIGIYFGGQEKSAFSMLIVLFTFTMVATLMVAEEHPLESEQSQTQAQVKLNDDLEHTNLLKGQGHDHHSSDRMNGLVVYESGYETCSNQSYTDESMYHQVMPNGKPQSKDNSVSGRKLWSLTECSLPLPGKDCNMPFRLRLTSFCSAALVGFYGWVLRHSPPFVQNLFTIPYILRKLALALFCSWSAIMSFNLFFTDFVGQAIYGGNPNGPEDSLLRTRYDSGVRTGSWGLLFHCITSAIYASFIERLVKSFGTRAVFLFGMGSFTLAMICMAYARDVYVVNFMAAMTGFAYATVTSLPFILVNSYHDDQEVSVSAAIWWSVCVPHL